VCWGYVWVAGDEEWVVLCGPPGSWGALMWQVGMTATSAKGALWTLNPHHSCKAFCCAYCPVPALPSSLPSPHRTPKKR
jgi:hypothetical protein